MKPDRRMPAVMIAYTLWLIFYLTNHYLGFIALPKNIESFVFMGVAAVALIFTATRIEDLRYSPVILLVFFALCGRLTAFAADFISWETSGSRLFMMPFGGFDFFVYHLLLIGLLRNLLHQPETTGPGFSPLTLVPIVFLVLPVFSDLLPKGLGSQALFSFGFTAIAVWSMGTAVHFRLRFSKMHIFAYAAGISVLFDLLIYLDRFSLPVSLPSGINYLLLPYGLFLLAHAALGIKKEDLND